MKINSVSLNSELKQKGMEGRVVPIQHLHDLQNWVEAEYKKGDFAEEFYHERLQFYRFKPPEDFLTAKSIMVVAVPRPQTPVRFSLAEKSITLTLPPTYARYEDTFRQTGDILAEMLLPAGFHIAPTKLPLKLLAASSGLVEYG